MVHLAAATAGKPSAAVARSQPPQQQPTGRRCWIRFLLLPLLLLLEAPRSSSLTLVLAANGAPPGKRGARARAASFAGAPPTTAAAAESSPAVDHQQQQQSREDELPRALLPRREQVQLAVRAVRRACAVAVALQPADRDAMRTDAALQKADASPVTVADFAVQASVLHALAASFGDGDGDRPVGFIAEEDSARLREDAALCRAVADAAGLSAEQVLRAIDLGQSYQTPSRVWCLDPIDGTRGFLRGRRPGGQYAIALALIEDGVPVIGCLGCPNLPTSDDFVEGAASLAWKENESDDDPHRGCIFVASQGGGCYQLPLNPATSSTATASTSAESLISTSADSDEPSLSESSASSTSREDSYNCTNDNAYRRLQVTTKGSVRDARFCIGVEKYSDAQGQTVRMARLLHGPNGVTADNVIVKARRMDSQAKHGVLARGGAEWYVRLPRPGYVEWIWDHAAGFVVATEAGGTVTDTEGRPIDFSLGAQLSPEVRGVLMSCGGAWHEALVRAYAAVNESGGEGAAAAAEEEEEEEQAKRS